MATVVLLPEAEQQYDELPVRIRARVEKIFDRLEQWPHVSGVKALSGNLAGHFRIRTGDYRVQFYVEEQTVVVEKVGHRDGFYED